MLSLLRWFFHLLLGRHQLYVRYPLLFFGDLILTLEELDPGPEVVDLVVSAPRLFKHVVVLILQHFDLLEQTSYGFPVSLTLSKEQNVLLFDFGRSGLCIL